MPTRRAKIIQLKAAGFGNEPLLNGIYTPATCYYKEEFKPALWRGAFWIPPTLTTSARIVKLNIRNSKDALAGKGIAEVFAKHLSRGKAINFLVSVKDKILLKNGFTFGPDSIKTVTIEINNFLHGETNIWAIRPPEWDQYGTQGYGIWQGLRKARMESLYIHKAKTFGYAKVIDRPKEI